jgi:hypothetical protein
VHIGDNVIIHAVMMLTNDRNPKANPDWGLNETAVKRQSSIARSTTNGRSTTNLPEVTIGARAPLDGAGAVDLKDVVECAMVASVRVRTVVEVRAMDQRAAAVEGTAKR